MVGLGAPQGRGGAKVAQVVGTVDHGLLPAPQRQDGPLGVPEGLGVLGRAELQHLGEVVVAALAAGAAVARLAAVAGLARGRGKPGAGRQRRGGGQRLQAGDPVGAEEVRPGGEESILLFLFLLTNVLIVSSFG